MADPLSATTGVLTLVTFGVQSVGSLLATIQDFRKYPSAIAQLKEELQALQNVLKSLQRAIGDGSYDFSELKLPINQCGEACKEFEAVIINSTTHSTENRRSFRDWTKLKYRGDDINTFKTMLASYKATIAIALCDANLRTTNITLDALNEYKELIQTTSCDLEYRFQEIDSKLQALLTEDGRGSNDNKMDLQRVEEEKKSLTQCLDICARVSSNIDELRPMLFENIDTPIDANLTLTSAIGANESFRLATASTLQNCNSQLQTASMWLKSQLADLEKHLSRSAKSSPQDSSAQTKDKESLRAEVQALLKSLAVCEEAAKQANQERKNVFEDIHMAEDGNQIMVSTVGDLIFARNVSAGARSTQVFGQMSDLSLQKFSQDRQEESRHERKHDQ